MELLLDARVDAIVCGRGIRLDGRSALSDDTIINRSTIHQSHDLKGGQEFSVSLSFVRVKQQP